MKPGERPLVHMDRGGTAFRLAQNVLSVADSCRRLQAHGDAVQDRLPDCSDETEPP